MTGLYHLAQCFQGSSMFRHVSELRFFFACWIMFHRMNIPYFVYLPISRWPPFGLFPLWGQCDTAPVNIRHKFSCDYSLSAIVGHTEQRDFWEIWHFGVRLFEETPDSSPKWLHLLESPPATCRGASFFASSPARDACVFCFCGPGGCEGVPRPDFDLHFPSDW